MAKFKYTGPEMMVGRFGRLKTGAIVDLWQSEADYVRLYDATSWEDVSVEDLTGVGVIVPLKVHPYDLTRINWLLETRSALKRMSRSELGDVAAAMRLIGCQIPTEPETRTLSREHLFEVIYGESIRLRWDQPGYQAIDRNSKTSSTPVVVKRNNAKPTEPTEPTVSDTDYEEAIDEDAEESEGADDQPKASKRIIRKRK